MAPRGGDLERVFGAFLSFMSLSGVQATVQRYG
jgi:hypothetical protein